MIYLYTIFKYGKFEHHLLNPHDASVYGILIHAHMLYYMHTTRYEYNGNYKYASKPNYKIPKKFKYTKAKMDMKYLMCGLLEDLI